MGSDIHVMVVGGTPGLADRARRRIEELEQRWSRFLPDSEISRLSAAAGTPLVVSPETVDLVTKAIEAWRFTGGAFDPTVLGAVVRAGYDRPFEELDARPSTGASDLVVGCTDIEIDGDTVRLPAGTGFDPGGIGKGLAADLVAGELLEAGADGACLNLGGDLRAVGAGPDDNGWTVALEHPWCADPLANIGIGDGAVATSTTLKRRWRVDGHERHHLIDPRAGEPSKTDLNLVTVVAASAWTCEVLAKAVLLRGSDHPFTVVDGSGAEAVAVIDDGRVVSTDGFLRFLGGEPLPTKIDPPNPN